MSLFDRVLFLVLTAVLCARPMISESFARASLSFLPIETSGGTTPATTVWLDAILLVSAVVIWIRNWRHVRVGFTSVALVLLLAAVVVSVAAAVDKRQAANNNCGHRDVRNRQLSAPEIDHALNGAQPGDHAGDQGGPHHESGAKGPYRRRAEEEDCQHEQCKAQEQPRRLFDLRRFFRHARPE